MSKIGDILAIEDGTAFAIALSNLVFEAAERRGVENLTEAEFTAFVVDGVEREVANGGFSQFYFNSAGDQARETVEALHRIGAHKMAELVEKANAAFGERGPNPDRDKRQEQLDEIGDTSEKLWNDLDGEWNDYPDDITTLMRKYVQENRAAFRE